MKIVHISSFATIGGAAIATLRLHQSLMKQPDVESTLIQKIHLDENFAKQNNIITAYTDRNLITRIRKKLNVHTEYYHWVKLNKYPENYEIATFATTSYRLEKLPIVKEADIIHLHWVGDFINYPTFFKNVKQPIVWTLHDINPMRGMFHFDSDIEKNKDLFGREEEKNLQIKIKAVQQSNNITIVCLSDWMRQKVMISPHLANFSHYIIPNGLDFSKYPFRDKIADKESIGVNNKLKTILVVGASLNNQQKGFPILFEAINKLGRKDFNFISVGHLTDYAVNRKDVNYIHVNNVENIEELNKYYSAADMTIIPSKEDNLPNVMLESFANGTPIMSFSNGGMAEHIKNGENGVLIDKIDVESLSKGIEDFLDNKYIFDSKKIREYAVEYFSDTLQVERYKQLYNSILK